MDSFTSLVLPSDADDRAVVQLRWAVWRGTMSGSSSGIEPDDAWRSDGNTPPAPCGVLFSCGNRSGNV